MEEIFKAIEAGKCLAFLGAGASMGYQLADGTSVPGLPSGSDLAKDLAAKCQYVNGHGYDLDKVAEHFLFRNNGDRIELETLLRGEISRIWEPRPIHTALAQLPNLRVVLTSNYDTLLETALTQHQRPITKNVYHPDSPKNAHFNGTIFFEESSREVILHKMHGSIETPGSLVITRSDYVRYLANMYDADRGMPEYFYKTMIPACTLLFLGYSLQDWNFMVIWEGVLAKYRNTGVKRKSFALVRGSTEFDSNYWLERNIKLINKDLTQFAAELAARFNLDIPQLGIKKTAPQ